jgi:ADP-ribose pyrophosphatase
MQVLRRIYRGRLINLSRQGFKLPNGHDVNLEVIDHPGAALVVPFLSSKEIILLRQFRPVVNRYLYELPAGTLNSKETHLSCARREIIEETGYCAKIFKRLGQIYPVPGYSTERIVIYKASDLKKVSTAKAEDDEVIKNCIVRREKIRDFFRQGKICDAKTICALTMVGWL